MHRAELLDLIDDLLQNRDEIRDTSIDYMGKLADSITVTTEDGDSFVVNVRRL